MFFRSAYRFVLQYIDAASFASGSFLIIRLSRGVRLPKREVQHSSPADAHSGATPHGAECDAPTGSEYKKAGAGSRLISHITDLLSQKIKLFTPLRKSVMRIRRYVREVYTHAYDRRYCVVLI